MPILHLRGFDIHKGYLTLEQQHALVADLRQVVQRAPMRAQVTPSGKQMSVKMSAAGSMGWISDQAGYRYAPAQRDGTPWPAMPEALAEIWRDLCGGARMPECCLINYYGEGARMGLHQDREERDFSQPVVSISLGDQGLLRVGGVKKGGSTESLWLASGDVVVMGGAARLAYHGVDRIRFGSSSLLPRGGRLNITLRVVT